MTMMRPCGSCGKPALWFSKELWAPLCASTAPAASTGRSGPDVEPVGHEARLDDQNGPRGVLPRRRVQNDRRGCRRNANHPVPKGPLSPLMGGHRDQRSRHRDPLAEPRVPLFELERRGVAERRVPPLRVVEANNETPIVPSRESFATAGTRGSVARSGCINRGGARGRASPSCAAA